MPAPTQIIVVDGHPPLREGLELLLPRYGFRVIGLASSAAEGARMIRARKPDVALVDIQVDDWSGTELAKAVRDEALATAIVLYTASITSAVIDAAASSGVRALALKTSPVAHIADAITAAAAGRNYVDPSVTRMSGRPRSHAGRRISKREAQVLGLLARGFTTEQLAAELFISPGTVQTHVRNATRKLEAHGRLHAVILALIEGEIDLPASAR